MRFSIHNTNAGKNANPAEYECFIFIGIYIAVSPFIVYYHKNIGHLRYHVPACRSFDPDLSEKLRAIQYYCTIDIGITKINRCSAKYIGELAKFEIL